MYYKTDLLVIILLLPSLSDVNSRVSELILAYLTKDGG